MSLPPPTPTDGSSPQGGASSSPTSSGAGSTPPPFGLPPAIPELEGLKKDLTASIDYLVAWVAIMIWDVVSTFPSEYRYVWKSDWSALKVLFFLNRYGSLVLQILNMSLVVANVSANFCSHFFWFTPLVTIHVLTLCGAIFAFRIYTLYDRNCTIRIILLMALSGQFATMVSTAAQFTHIEFDSAAREFLDFHGCMVSGKPGKSMAPTIIFWTAPFVFSLLILGLALYRSLTTTTVAGVKVSLVQAMLRDGIWYFSVPVATNLCSVILAAQTANPNLHNFNAAGSIGLNFVMASRLMLSLFIHNASSTTSSGPHGSHESPRFVPTFPSNNFAAAGSTSATSRPRVPVTDDEEKVDHNLDIEAGIESGRIEMERKSSGTTFGDSRSIRSKASDGTFQITGNHGIEEELDDEQNEKDARSGSGGRENLSTT